MFRFSIPSFGAVLLLLCVARSGSATTPYTFSNVFVPGAAHTVPTGINDAGQIVGTYTDSANVAHGFLLSGGVFTTIDFPGAVGTYPRGISNNGQIVGYFGHSGGAAHGDVYPFLLSGGVFTALPEAPGSIPGTTNVWAINNSGQIVGYYDDPCACAYRGFVLSGGTFTSIDRPSFSTTSPFGINDLGQIVGTSGDGYFGETTPHGFLLSGGTFTNVDVPFSVVNSKPTGINNAGDMAGNYYNGLYHAFVLINGTLTLLDHPMGTLGTAIWGQSINSARQVVGSYQDGGTTRGFLAVPTPTYNICLLYDPTKAVRSGATIPIKLQLCSGDGSNLSSPGITVHAIDFTQVSTSISGVIQDSGNANPDNDFRYDATLGNTGGYIFNLKTTGLSTGTYLLNFKAGTDLAVYQAQFQVK